MIERERTDKEKQRLLKLSELGKKRVAMLRQAPKSIRARQTTQLGRRKHVEVTLATVGKTR